MNKILVVLLLITMESNVMQAKLPITPEKVKKELFNMLAVATSENVDEGYIKYVTADKQINYLTVQVNDMYGYMRYLDRLKLDNPLEFEDKRSHLTVMQRDTMKRCREDYSYMEEEGLNCFVNYSRRIASVLAFNDRLRGR